MPGPERQPARLYLQPGRVRRGKVDPPTWVIRDGPRKRGTDFVETEKDFAELALAKYVREQPLVGRNNYLYFISAFDRPDYPIKIGITSDHAPQLWALQTSSPYRLDFLALIQVTDRDIEREMHRRFSSHRLQGEWFERTPEIMATVERLLETYGALGQVLRRQGGE